MPATITVYTTGPGCPQCRCTCRRFEAAGVRFEEVDLTSDPNATARAHLIDDLGFTRAPVVVAGDTAGECWSGFDPDRIDQLIARIREQP